MKIYYRGPAGAIMFIVWSVGEPRPFGSEQVWTVGQITASGKELEHIRSKFTNIPTAASMSEVHWYGDFAKFIVANL